LQQAAIRIAKDAPHTHVLRELFSLHPSKKAKLLFLFFPPGGLDSGAMRNAVSSVLARACSHDQPYRPISILAPAWPCGGEFL